MAFSNAQLAVLLSSQCCSMPEPGQPVQGHAVRGGAVQHRHRVRLKNCRITIIKVGQGHRQRGRVAGPKSWPQQQLRQQWGNNVVCNCRLINSVAKRIRATPPPSNVFHFFHLLFLALFLVLLFLIFLMFIAIAIAVVAVARCSFCCSLSTAFGNTGKGMGGRQQSRVRQVLARSVLWPHYTAKLEQPSLLCSALLYSVLLRLRHGLCI